jgi:hypothetical protein
MPNIGFWATGAGAAAAGAYELISTTILGSATSTVTLNSIPNTYKYLQVRLTARASDTGSWDFLIMRFNGDTISTYARHDLNGNGSGVSAGFAQNTSGMAIARVTANGGPAGAFGAGIIDVFDYADTNKYTTVRALGGQHGSGARDVNLSSGLWPSTAAVTSITFAPVFSGTILAGSRFSVYGIKGV